LKRFVVDASVGFKWIVPNDFEPLRDQAVHLTELRYAQQVELIVPDFFWIELGNALWKAARSKKIDAIAFDKSRGLLLRSDIPSFPSRELLPSALLIAAEFDRSVYDSLYIALAKESSCQLITADEKLVNAVASRLPVVWLGSDFALSF
jgi:predicted nucleic acid-binding protein